MAFLQSLADQLQSQFSLGENKTNSLDSIIDGQYVQYGALGDFASKIDKSAERSYVEEGFLRKGSTEVDVKQLEILMQQPSATILVKKRMVSSLAENYRPEFMDQDERLYFKAMKTLFYNKCNQISALEKISKIQKITSIIGSVDEQLMPILFTLSDVMTPESSVTKESQNFQISGGSATSEVSSFQEVMNRLRRLYGFNKTSPLTSWITDSTNLFASQVGEGTGVIEITNFTDFNVNNSVKGSGDFNLSIVDPYNMMTVTEYDIEKAISDATNVFNNYKSLQFGQQGSDQVISNLQFRFSQLRRQRNASSITFKINPNTLLSRRLTAIIDNSGQEIYFEYNPFNESALTSGLSGDGTSGVTVTDPYLEGGEVAGFDGLSKSPVSYFTNTDTYFKVNKPIPESELTLFQQLVQAIYTKINLDASAQNALQQGNQLTNYARKKLRFNFLGKLILQPMDSIHFYINSKSNYDNKLLAGLKSMFTGSNYLQSVNAAFYDLKQSSNLFNPKDLSSQIEKSIFVGNDFPSFLWNLMRNQFVTENEGTHVFAGLIDKATLSYSGGAYNVNITGQNNYKYLTLGHVNFKPAHDVWNGVFYDPLTPFQTRFDTVSTNYRDESPKLLPDNQILLGNKEDPFFLKFKNGPNAGRPANMENYIGDRSVDPVTKRFSKTFYAPDGLVYKWREGIGAFVQFGSSLTFDGASAAGSPNLTQEPFAGQDVMNCVSLLITGVPYNFVTYWNAVRRVNGYTVDPQSQQSPAHTFLGALQNDLKKRNTLWGNFIPFKNLNIDESSYKQTLSTLDDINKTNQLLEVKLKEYDQLNQQSVLYFTVASSQTNLAERYLDNAQKQKIVDATQAVSNEINNLLAKASTSQTSKGNLINQVGNDVSFDPDDFLTKEDQKDLLPSTRGFLRRQVNFLTRRMSYSIRSNEDKNFFIVDDFYDKDYDIAAFNSDLDNQGASLFRSEFNTVNDQITTVSDLLNLEVFCDTQGHIRARPPLYNRMPSSIFYKMIQQKNTLGIQVFPQFMDDLFSQQLFTLAQRVEILEDEIRLDCAILNQLDDISAQSFINTAGGTSTNQGQSFAFVSDDSGSISDITAALSQVNPDALNEITTFADSQARIKDLDVLLGRTQNIIQKQTQNIKNLFTNQQRFALIKKVIDTTKADPKLASSQFSIFNEKDFEQNERINILRSRIEQKSAQKVTFTSFAYSQEDNVVKIFSLSKYRVDIFKVTENLAAKLAERQKVLKLFYGAVKNAKEFISLDADTANTSNKLLLPGTYGNKNIPEVFEHMIEDESFDDYGPGSGQRYIIKNSQIRNFSFSESTPQYTSVQVSGVLNNYDSGALPSGLDSFPSSGNGMVTARAIDYDLWRNYGLMSVRPINVPFFRNPDTQCAPYAVSLLSRSRSNILQGTVTLSGNEYYQPGDVVFIEDRNLLFYVETVNHDFRNGEDFTTRLELTYGHTPGQYIPTALDIVGKLLYKNGEFGNYQVFRQGSTYNESNYGAIIFDQSQEYYSQSFSQPQNGQPTSSLIAQPENGQPGGSLYGPTNSTIINNLIFTSAYKVYNDNLNNKNVVPKVELRVYYDSKFGSGEPNSDLLDFAEYIKLILSASSAPTEPIKSNNAFKQPSITLPKENVSVVLVDVSKDTDYKSPSAKAISAARNLSKQSTASIYQNESEYKKKLEKQKAENEAILNQKTGEKKDPKPLPKVNFEREVLRNALFSYIVDCWVKLEPLPPQPNDTPSANTTASTPTQSTTPTSTPTTPTVNANPSGS